MNVRVDPSCLVDEPLADRIRRRLRADLGEEIFTSWFGRLELIETIGGAARFSVPTKFLKSWIQAHYGERLLRIAAEESPEIRTVAVEVRSSARPVAAKPMLALVRNASPPAAKLAVSTRPPPSPAPSPRAAEPVLPSSPLDPRMTFATLVAGRANQLAASIGQTIASQKPDQPRLYNPLFTHGATGVGKTHLLTAIANTIADDGHQRLVVLTAEKFMYGFVVALREQATLSFREKLRSIDVLVVDDIQFLQGKTIRDEFSRVVDALLGAGKQLVVAADVPPRELENFDDRLRSRLAGGLTIEIGAPDHEQRVAILDGMVTRARALVPGFALPPEAMAYLASVLQPNGRDLAGAVNRLLAQASMTQGPLTMEIVEAATRDLVRQREPRKVKIEDIQKLVANHYNVTRPDILSSRRTANVVRPRQIAMYLSKVLTLRSLPEIGRRFGGRDHTTVLHAVRKIEGLVGDDKTLGGEVDLLRRMLVED